MRAANFAMAYAGFMVGWLVHPSLWLIGGPFRWASLLLGTYMQEGGLSTSAFNPEKTGSGGFGQFQTDTWNEVAPERWATASSAFGSSDPRRDAWKTGYVSASYVAAAIGSDLRWWLCALPLVGFLYLRWLWRAGTGGLQGGVLRGLSEQWSYMTTKTESGKMQEQTAFLYFYGSRLLTVIPFASAVMRRAKRGR